MNKKTGFTLVEILVVVTIIGMLAAIGVASYTTFTKNARNARRKADLEQIRAAIELYRSNNNTYPTSLTVNCSSVGGITDGSGNTYMSQLPLDPKCNTYSYYYTASASDYTLGTYLEGSTTTCASPPSCSGASCNYCVGPYGTK